MKIRVNKEEMKRGWAKELNSLIWEMNEIEDKIEEEHLSFHVDVINTDSGNTKRFRFVKSDTDASNEDIYGWNYVAEDGLKLLLIND